MRTVAAPGLMVCSRETLRWVPLLAALLPVAGVVIALQLSVRAGAVPDCVPFIEGCTSISATGRQPPGSYWFKGLMIPGAVFMMVYWKLASDWLAVMGDRAGRVRGSMLLLGITAALGLIVYCIVLGDIGDQFRLQRRIGVILYFGLGSLAQVLLTARLYPHRHVLPGWVVVSKLAVCGLILAAGWLNITLSLFYSRFDAVEDIFEWNIALLSISYFLLTYFLWRATGFQARLVTVSAAGERTGPGDRFDHGGG